MWSAWEWVSSTASICSTQLAMHWRRNSGPASTCTCVSPSTTWIDARVRLFRGSSDRHTSQLQAITGTPWDVPVPRNVTRNMNSK